MADSRILEVMIATDDHRMLSANAEAWWLVQNDVFVPFESFLTKESKQVFLEHLDASDTTWFLAFFSNEPELAYLTKIEPEPGSGGSSATIRIVLTRLDLLMDEHLRQNDALASCEAMLSFHDDLYFEYLAETDQVILYNTRQTHFSQGVIPLDEFSRQLEQNCEAESVPAVQEWMDHLRKGTPRFRQKIPCNVINREDQGVYSVSVRGMRIHHRSGKSVLVGIAHPMRERNNEENEITYDSLTGAVSREHIIRIAQDRINRLKVEGTAVAILDVDYFKHINDSYGHQHGDDILRKVATIMQEEIKSAGLVGRIGGDEFMLLFYHVSGEVELRAYLRSIKSVIGATLDQVTVSIGAAVYPDDAGNYSDLFMVADYCLYLGKGKGRNRYIIHTLAKHPPVEEIRMLQAGGERGLIKGRDDLPLGEVLVQMQYRVRYGKPPEIAALLNEFAIRANLPLVSLWRRDDRSLVAAGGKEKQDADALHRYFEDHAPDEMWIPAYEHDGMCVMNTVDNPEEGYREVRDPLTACEVGSYIYIPFEDPDGIPAALVFAVVHRKVFWNEQQYMHYRLFANTVACCRINAGAAGRRYSFPAGARAVLEEMEQPIAIYQLVDSQVRTLLVSRGFCRLLGYADRDEAVYNMDHRMYKETHPDDRARIIDAAERFIKDGGEYDVVFRTRAGAESGYHVIHAHGKHVFPEPGVRIAHIWYMDEGPYTEGDESTGSGMNRMISSALHEESILMAAHYDELTGLPNLSFFFKLCEAEKARTFREGKQGALLYMDLDGMKYYNHRNGFAQGDRLLKAFSEILARIFGKDNCCHVAGDRFAACAPAEGIEGRLQKLFEEAGRMNGGSTLPVRAGIYCTEMEDVSASSAYDRAKIACDAIRKPEGSVFSYYSAKLRDDIKRRQHVTMNIDRAVREKWIRVYYQPIIRAADHQVCELEALARWMDPAAGFMSPAEFIPYLEDAGLIYKLDLCVLEQVLEKIRSEENAGAEVFPHSINLSRSDFDTCDMVEEIRKRVDSAGVSHRLITIEITESVIGSDFEFIREQVARFRNLGFPVWMDDFGSGYSSLDVLQSIPFDLIKFDMAFMRKLDEGKTGRIILTELMKLAEALGVDTVCEGVETESQFRFLREIGCSRLQGFYFSKPLPEEEIRVFRLPSE